MSGEHLRRQRDGQGPHFSPFRGRSQNGDLHRGHCTGFVLRGVQVAPQRRQVHFLSGIVLPPLLAQIIDDHIHNGIINTLVLPVGLGVYGNGRNPVSALNAKLFGPRARAVKALYRRLRIYQRIKSHNPLARAYRILRMDLTFFRVLRHNDVFFGLHFPPFLPLSLGAGIVVLLALQYMIIIIMSRIILKNVCK